MTDTEMKGFRRELFAAVKSGDVKKPRVILKAHPIS